MKQVHPNYTFTASSKTISLTGLNIEQDQLLLVTNSTRGVVYYNFASSLLKATVTPGQNTTIILTDANTTGHSDSDHLIIYYDDQKTLGSLTTPLAVNQVGLTSTNIRGPEAGSPAISSTQDSLKRRLDVQTQEGLATSAGQTTVNNTLTNVANAVGYPTDPPPATDTTSSGLVGICKRILQRFTTLLDRIPSLASGRIPIDGSGVTQPVSGTVTANLSNTVTATWKGAIGSSNAVPVVFAQEGSAGGSVISYDGSNTSLNVNVKGSLPAISGTVAVSSIPDVPLPSGASTAANQATANTTLASISNTISGRLPQLTTSGKIPVEMSTSSITIDNISVSGIGAETEAPASSDTATSGLNGLLKRVLQKFTTLLDRTPALVFGKVPVSLDSVSATSFPLPTGAATAANQLTSNSTLSSIDGKIPAGLTQTAGSLNIKGVVSLGDVNVNGSSLAAEQHLASSLGTKSESAATTDTGTFSLIGLFKRLLQRVTTLIPANLTVTSSRLQVDGSGVTQPVSVSSLPLPIQSGKILVDGSGVTQPVNATIQNSNSVAQAIINESNSYGSISVNLAGASSSVSVVQATATNLKTQAESYQGGAAVGSGNPLHVTLANTGANATAVKVDGSATVQPIYAASLPIPFGAATSANQTTTNTNLSNIHADLGSPSDVKATTDTATSGIIGLIKRLLADKLPSALASDRLKVDGSGVVQPVSGTISANIKDGNGNSLSSAARGSERALSVQIVDASGNQVTSFGGSGSSSITSFLGQSGLPLQVSSNDVRQASPSLLKAQAEILSQGQAVTISEAGTPGSPASDVITVQGVSGMTAIDVNPSGSSANTSSQNTTGNALSANPNRRSFCIYNQGPGDVWIGLGATAATVKLFKDDYFEHTYRGQVTASFSGTATIFITEIM